MFSHIMIGADDLDAARKFYDATLGALGVAPAAIGSTGRLIYKTAEGAPFVVTKPLNGQPACAANGGTIGFHASSPEQAEAWHAAGVANGGATCENPPGVRDIEGMGKLYLAYLRDPSGNKLCALHSMAA